MEIPEWCVKYVIDNNKDTRTVSWRRFVALIVNFQQISQIVLVFSLLTLNTLMPAGAPIDINTKNCIVYWYKWPQRDSNPQPLSL